MKHSKPLTAILLALLLPAAVGAYDGPPARGRLEAEDAYIDARHSLEDAEATVVQIRESLMREAMSAPEYLSAIKAVDATFAAYTARRDAVLAGLQKDQRYSEQQKEIAARDARIESAGQNPATTAKEFNDLCNERDSLARSMQTLIDDALKREGALPSQSQWVEASRKLTDLRSKLQDDAGRSPKLKPALDKLAAARAAVDQARANLHDPAVTTDQDTATADEYLRQFPHYGIGLGDNVGKPAK